MLKDKSIYREGKPSVFYRIKQKTLSKLSVRGRKALNTELHNNLSSKEFSIIASFCGGGTLYHDAGMQFLSPTINLAFDGEDFIKFVGNLKLYLQTELEEYKTEEVSYPVGRLQDVEIRFVHYHTFDEAARKWKERSKRINFDNIIIMATDRDGMGTAECMAAFDKLPYKKVMFTSTPHPEYSWAVFCPCFKGQKSVGTMTGIADISGHRYYEKYLDILSFICG